MKGTCVEGTIPKLFEGKMEVSIAFLFTTETLIGNAFVKIKFCDWRGFLISVLY